MIAAISAIRNLRTSMNVPPSVKAKVCIETQDQELFRSCGMFFEKLAFASGVEVASGFTMEDAATAVTDACRIFIPMDELVDKEKELARLERSVQPYRRIWTSLGASSTTRASWQRLLQS